VSAATGDDDGDPAVAIVVAGNPAHDRVVVRVKREVGYADRVKLVVARRVRIVRPLVRKGERRGGARAVDRDDVVEFAHTQPRDGVREELGEGLCEGRVGEPADRVGVPGDHSFQIRAERLGIGGVAEPGGLQAAFVCMRGCVQSSRVSDIPALRTYDCAVFTTSQGWDESALTTENVTGFTSAITQPIAHAETSRHDSPSSAT